MLILTSLLCTHSIHVKILIFICKISTLFILACSCKLGFIYTNIYEEFIIITYNQPFLVISILLQLLLLTSFFIVFFKNIGFKKLAVFIVYIYSLHQFIDSCITYNITNIFCISLISISSIFTVIAVYKNCFYKESKTPKLSMFKEFLTKFNDFLYNFHFLPEVHKRLLLSVFIIYFVITRLPTYVLFDLSGLSGIGLTSRFFILFSLIVPSIIFSRIVTDVILHIRLAHGNVSILSVIFKELFNISHYNIKNIDLNLILTFFTLGILFISSVDLIYFYFYGFNSYILVNEGIGLDTKNYYWHTICSCDDSSIPTVDPSNSPTPTDSFLSFASSSRSPSPDLRFEEQLWVNRRNSLADAKALDVGKRILLYKICLARNISNDIQMLIQDNIWGNHWYELYTQEYSHDESGNIVHNSLLHWLPGDVTFSTQDGFYSLVDGNYYFTGASTNT